MANKNIKCSFCGKSQSEVNKIIAGPGVYICDECIKLCTNIIEFDESKAETKYQISTNDELPTPEEIKKVLDEYIIGQDEAKKTLSVAVYNHYKRINTEEEIDDVEIQKSNILLLGPTGCGKTYLAQTLAKTLKVPFAIADATTLTEAGYVGEDVENILLKLIQAADYDIEKAETGIIYIDEIDKISRKSENPSITRDVSGEGVQQALLKIVEGTIASVPPQGGRKHPHQELIQIDTSNILFICGGALRELDKEALIEIMTKPKNALTKQYKKLLKLDGVELEFTQDALEAMVEKAIERKTGARGLRSIIEDSMRDVMYEVPSNSKISKCIITKDVVEKKEKAKIEIDENKEEVKIHNHKNKKKNKSSRNEETA